MDIVSQIVEAEFIGRLQSHLVRTSIPPPRAIQLEFGRVVVPPGIETSFPVLANGPFPLGLGGQAKGLAGPLTQPAAIGVRLHPADRNHRLPRMAEARLREGFGHSSPGLTHEKPVLLVGHGRDAHGKGIDPDAMNRSLVRTPPLAAHEIFTAGQCHHGRNVACEPVHQSSLLVFIRVHSWFVVFLCGQLLSIPLAPSWISFFACLSV